MEVTYRLGDHDLTSLTAWRSWELRENTDSDGTPQKALSINFGRSDVDQLTQELRLASPTGNRIEYVVGLYYFNAELRGNNGQVGSLSLTSATPVSSRYFVATNRTESVAAFGQATFRATDKAAPDPWRSLHARRRLDGLCPFVLSGYRAFLAATDPSTFDLRLQFFRASGSAVRFRARSDGVCDRDARLQGARL